MYTHTCAYKHIAFFKSCQHRNKSISLQLDFLLNIYLGDPLNPVHRDNLHV